MNKPTDPRPPRHQPSAPAQSQDAQLHDDNRRANWKRHNTELLDTSLQSFTQMWFESLPDSVKPHNCAQHYPRVLNKIAALWSLNERCLDYLNGLVIDTRGDRQGFSYGVLGEMRRLRTHRMATMRLPPSQEPTDFNGHTDFMSTVPMAPDEWPPKR